MPVNVLLGDPSFFKHVLEELYDGVYIVDISRNILFWNKGAERITGYSADEVVNRNCADDILMHVDVEGKRLCRDGCPVQDACRSGEEREFSVFLHHREGHRIPVSAKVSPLRNREGEIVGAVEIFSDNSRLHQSMDRIKRLETQAFRDPLTLVMNRRYANTFIPMKLEEMKSLEILPPGILFIDIDHFKKFNDNYGHQIGDKVLLMVANTIVNVLREGDMVCRWGGEEFLVVLSECRGVMLERVAERIRILIESSSIVERGEQLSVTVSIGGAIARIEDTAESLVRRADELMYVSKNTGRNISTIQDK
jgi:diguanylate cyclase (GGDEF)-like protein/PAS domain S-box-containing protein